MVRRASASPRTPSSQGSARPLDAADRVASLARGLAIIESFDDDHPRRTIAEVSAATDIPRSAVRRHLLSLIEFGYAASDGKRYWLTPRVLRLGQSYLASARLPRLVQPFLQRLAQVTGETSNASVLDGHDVVYIARGNPPRLITVGYQIGARVPAHVVTPGPVILARWPDDALARWVGEHDFRAFTARTVTAPMAFLDEVQTARARDWWATVGQYDSAFAGIAVALVDRKGACHGALSLTVLSSQYTLERMERDLLPPLREAAQALKNLV
jgi:IclR family pca regulon transcriptional regulator